jgi:hypothetical protein
MYANKVETVEEKFLKRCSEKNRLFDLPEKEL